MADDLKNKYGKEMQPLKATRAWVKPIDHFQSRGIDAKSWVLVDDEANKVVYVNTYSDKPGKKWSPKFFDLNEGKLEKKVKGYQKIDVADCPLVDQQGNP